MDPKLNLKGALRSLDIAYQNLYDITYEYFPVHPDPDLGELPPREERRLAYSDLLVEVRDSLNGTLSDAHKGTRTFSANTTEGHGWHIIHIVIEELREAISALVKRAEAPFPVIHPDATRVKWASASGLSLIAWSLSRRYTCLSILSAARDARELLQDACDTTIPDYDDNFPWALRRECLMWDDIRTQLYVWKVQFAEMGGDLVWADTFFTQTEEYRRKLRHISLTPADIIAAFEMSNEYGDKLAALLFGTGSDAMRAFELDKSAVKALRSRTQGAQDGPDSRRVLSHRTQEELLTGGQSDIAFNT